MSVTLLKGDVFEQLENVETDSVDLIVADLPYGMIKNLNKDLRKIKGSANQADWDKLLDLELLFKEFDRVLRLNGKLIMFSQSTFTNLVRKQETIGIKYAYNLVWVKNRPVNPLQVNQKPMSKHEDITVFNKNYDTNFKHPLRKYAKKCLEYTGLSRQDFLKGIGKKIEHFFVCSEALNFRFPIERNYKQVTEKYNLKDMPGYLTYDEMKEINSKYKKIFNRTTEKAETTVLEYNNPSRGSVHPTQKPVDLLEHLIKMYSNENDTIFDPTFGSGSTGVACVNTNRNFIGIEKDDSYFEIAEKRISEALNNNE